MILSTTWADLRAKLADPQWNGAELNPLLRELAGLSAEAEPDERSRVVADVAEFLSGVGLHRGAFAALWGGTLIEHGAPSDALFAVLQARVPEALGAAGRLFERVRDLDLEALEAEGDADPSGVTVGGRMLPRSLVRPIFESDREAVQTWTVLSNWCLPLIAVGTRDRDKRAALASDRRLADLARAIAPHQGHARYLYDLVVAPLAEALRFVDRASGRVFELEMDGVAVNFELHTLLAAALAGPLGHEPPPDDVLRCLGAPGPQACSTPSAGTWDFYRWRALAIEGPVPRELWVWNEGRPEDIEPFEGVRVVVGDRPSYGRTWNTGRTFGALAPTVRTLAERPPAEATALLAAIRAQGGA